ncbi:zinc-binding dehydrogenase [uncultured Williamsia sp.]|uniref:zinc-binding dehydrogenase n=1 Tax=uncultured Williamsia sp. TaxID=259311 RepID=UPI00262124DC|nr:zinc-binding dehydrogenase [uncultured Williamsia sp.]
MLAAVLDDFGTPLDVREVPDPGVRGGEVVVDVLATCVLPYASEVFGGARRYPLEPPVVPGLGGIARVVTTGPDATRLTPGDLVWCDATVRSRDDANTPDITLQGWSSRGDGGLRLSRHFHDGSFAERMSLPTECVYPVGDVDEADAARWSALGIYLVPYGGLLAADFRAGESLLVSGATGNFGSAAVAVGLAMGAGRVVAVGRDRRVLDDLRARFGARVHTVALTGEADEDQASMTAAGGGPLDVVLDILPPAVDAGVVRTAVMTVREYGRVVLMGGVGMLGGADLALPYPWLMRNSVTVRGQWMYPRDANARLIELARAGLLDLRQDGVHTFPLARVNDAIAYAADNAGPFVRTVLAPNAH